MAASGIVAVGVKVRPVPTFFEPYVSASVELEASYRVPAVTVGAAAAERVLSNTLLFEVAVIVIGSGVITPVEAEARVTV